jgi:hypothetical protein
MGSIASLPWFNEAKSQQERPVLEMLRLHMTHSDDWEIIPTGLRSEDPQLHLLFCGDSPTRFVIPEKLSIAFHFNKKELLPHYSIRVEYFRRNGNPESIARQLYTKQFSIKEIAERVQKTLADIHETALIREQNLTPLWEDFPVLEKKPSLDEALSFSVLENKHFSVSSANRLELCVAETHPDHTMVYSSNGQLAAAHHSLDDIGYDSRVRLLSRGLFSHDEDPSWHGPLQVQLSKHWINPQLTLASKVIRILRQIPSGSYHDLPPHSEFFPAARLRLNPAPEKGSKIIPFS